MILSRFKLKTENFFWYVSVLSVAVFLLVGITSTSFAASEVSSSEQAATGSRSYIYKNIDIVYKVNTDSTVDVAEYLTYKFTGEYHQGWRTIPLNGVGEILNVKVVDAATGQPLSYYYFELDKTKPSSWGYYTTKNTKDKNKVESLNIIWYYDAKDTEKTWIVKYKMHGSLGFYKDHDEFYWNAFTDYDVLVGASNVFVLLPKKLADSEVKLKVWRSLRPSTFGASLVNSQRAYLAMGLPEDFATVLYRKNIAKFEAEKEYYTPRSVWFSSGDDYKTKTQNELAAPVESKLKSLLGTSSENLDITNFGIAAYSAVDFPAKERFTVYLGFPKSIVNQGAFWVDFVVQKLKNGHVLGLLLLSLTLILVLRHWYFAEIYKKGRGVIVPEYEPPMGLTPAIADIILREKPSSKAIPATIIDLAVRGFITIKEDHVPFFQRPQMSIGGLFTVIFLLPVSSATFVGAYLLYKFFEGAKDN
ncbi:MAG: DUF2207 domain-containing protein, partial [Candidatus Paceibacterota bacterium]